MTVPSNTSAEDTLINVQNSLANNDEYGGVRVISSEVVLDQDAETGTE